MTPHETTSFPASMSAEHTEQQSDHQQRMASALSMQRTRPPADIPNYDTQKFLGNGAYGEVWVAVDRNTGRQVAVKFYTHRGGLDWKLLDREVETLVLLSADRYIVQVLDVGWDANPPYYVMEYIENGSLDDYLKEHGQLPASEAVEIFRDVATGLMHAHGKGVLHCDVKPANVLLDQDHKPRLADFGQSRLSHEQKPALGTLFYMAPEQADMEAVPDARWDVYALGAMLYLMLTGELPFRNESAITQINLTTTLDDRLASYRAIIRNSAPPAAHRHVRGVDRALIDIVDRCLAADPQDRFANVQSVLDALSARDRARARRPLLTMGILGPAILLIVMSVFGWWGYDRAVTSSDAAVTEKAEDSNRFASQFVSSGVSHELERYFRAVELLAMNERFIQLFDYTIHHDELSDMLAKLRDLDGEVQDPARLKELEELRQQFEQHPTRQRLQQYVAGLFQSELKPQVASWVTINAEGTHVATAFPPDSPPSRSPIGRNYAWRSYFHGDKEDLAKGSHPKPVDRMQPPAGELPDTRLSAVFQSTATNTWKVAVSTPIIHEDGRFLGILALTVEMGGFLKEFQNTPTRFAVLVDGREATYKGVILQHPLFDDILNEEDQLPSHFNKYRVKLNGNSNGQIELETKYRDPLAADPAGKHYDRPWITAKAPVKLPRGRDPQTGDPIFQDIGWVVLVQQDYASATEPVHLLGRRLVSEGLTALGVVIGMVTLLWYFVIRAVGDPLGTQHHRRIGPADVTMGAEKTTLPGGSHS